MGRHWLKSHSDVSSNGGLGPANKGETEVVSGILEPTLSRFDPRTARALRLHSALQAFCGREELGKGRGENSLMSNSIPACRYKCGTSPGCSFQIRLKC